MADLPNFHISLAEKIEWMIETRGFAVEPVAADPQASPPRGGYLYTIGFPEAFGFAEVIVFGLTPAQAGGMVDLVAEVLRGGTEIPVGVELTGLFDHDLRAVFAPVSGEVARSLCATGSAWRRHAEFPLVQLLWPDRNGFLPTEPGFDPRLRLAQPVLPGDGPIELGGGPI